MAITRVQGSTAASRGAVSAPEQLLHLAIGIYVTMTIIKASRVYSTPYNVCAALGVLPGHCMGGHASSMPQTKEKIYVFLGVRHSACISSEKCLSGNVVHLAESYAFTPLIVTRSRPE